MAVSSRSHQEPDPTPSTRRAFLKTSLGVGAALLASACAPTSPVSPAAQTSPAPVGGATPAGAATGTKTIDHWTFLDLGSQEPRGQATAQLFKDFTSATGITVNVQNVPWQDIDQKLLAAVQANNAPDVSRVRHFQYPRHVKAKSLLPLTNYAKQAYPGDQLGDFVVRFDQDGQVNAFLVENISNALYVRADWLKQIGASEPKTWDEFVALGKEFQKLKPDAAGFLSFASTSQLNHTEEIFQPMIHGRGGKLLEENGRAAFNKEPGIETFTFLRDLVHTHKILSPDVVSMTFDGQTDAFIAGKGAMAIDGSHRYARIAKGVGEANVKVVRTPGPTAQKSSPAMVTGWLLGIPRNAKKPEDAWKLMEYHLRPETQELFARVAGGLPSRKSTLERPFFKTPEAATISWWLQYIADNGELLVIPEKMSELNEILAQAFQRVVLQPGDKVKDVLDEAAKRYDALLA